jgi:hypothetical protein
MGTNVVPIVILEGEDYDLKASINARTTAPKRKEPPVCSHGMQSAATGC